MTMSNAASTAPVAKKPKINQFRRLLWHMNRTDLGWVTKTALTGLQLGARAKRIELLNTLPVKPEWSEASRQLSEQGHVDVTSIVDRSLAEAVAAVAQSKVDRLDELAGKQVLGHKSFWVSLLDEDLVDGAFATDHPFVRYALQPAALRIIGDFMHELPQLSDVLLTLSRPTENKPLSYSQLWHLDHDDKRVCKLFIYLTDVRDTADGPLTFIPAPASKPFRNTIKSHMSDDKVFPGSIDPRSRKSSRRGCPRSSSTPRGACIWAAASSPTGPACSTRPPIFSLRGSIRNRPPASAPPAP